MFALPTEGIPDDWAAQLRRLGEDSPEVEIATGGPGSLEGDGQSFTYRVSQAPRVLAHLPWVAALAQNIAAEASSRGRAQVVPLLTEPWGLNVNWLDAGGRYELHTDRAGPLLSAALFCSSHRDGELVVADFALEPHEGQVVVFAPESPHEVLRVSAPRTTLIVSLAAPGAPLSGDEGLDESLYGGRVDR